MGGVPCEIPAHPAADVQAAVEGADQSRVYASAGCGSQERQGAAGAFDGDYLFRRYPGRRTSLYHGGGSQGGAGRGRAERQDSGDPVAGQGVP